eukprot:g7981.t1
MNVNWINSPGTWTFYIVLIVLARLFLALLGFGAAMGWTTLHVIHATISFAALHYMKGSPDGSSQGDYNHATFWEQIEEEGHWSPNKKLLCAVPTVLCLLALVTGDYQPVFMWTNVPCWCLEMIPKFPVYYKVRPRAWSTTTGIDDDTEAILDEVDDILQRKQD